MGGFNCGHCGLPRHSDDHGYHRATADDGTGLDLCDDCLVPAMVEHLDGNRPLVAVDGHSLTDHFVCPDCVEVCPSTEMVEYLDREGWVSHRCTFCSRRAA